MLAERALVLDSPEVFGDDHELEPWPIPSGLVTEVPPICDGTCRAALRALAAADAPDPWRSHRSPGPGWPSPSPPAITSRSIETSPRWPDTHAERRPAAPVAREAIAGVLEPSRRAELLALLAYRTSRNDDAVDHYRALGHCDSGCERSASIATHMTDALHGSRAAALSRWRMLDGGLLAATAVRTSRPDLAEALRHRERAEGMRPAHALLSDLLVERGLARSLGDEARGERLDRRIERFEAMLDDRDRASALRVLDWDL